jgi:hypothetical protein
MGGAIFLPIQFFGFFGFLKLWLSVGIAAALVAGIIGFLIWAGKDGWLFDWLDLYIRDPIDRGVGRTKETLQFRNQAGVSLWSLIWHQVIVAKHQLCPLVEIKQEEEE